jgi:Arc/MetJ family transcription regulator
MYTKPMRTTIEMRDEHRAALLQLAARRGLKGFSGLVEDAITGYLRAEAAREERRRAASRLKGALTKSEARAFHDRTAALRDAWR